MTDNNNNRRSNFEPGTTRWAVQRAQWIAMGLKEEDFTKPKIAVVNTSSKLSVCYQHLDKFAKITTEAIEAAGALAFEIRTATSSDFITSAGREGRYLMPTRDLMSFDVEVQVEGAVLDGMILLSSCDKTTPAHLMAAARQNIPSIVVSCGYQLGGSCGSKMVDIETLYNAVGTYKSGEINLDQLTEMSRHAIKGPGVCAGLATANSMHVLAEALGMSMPGNAPIRADSDRLVDVCKAAGNRIVGMVNENLTPRKILNAAAFRNALTVAVALGASVNTVRHLTAIALEAELDFDILSELEAIADKTPLVAEVRPNGETRIEQLEEAGGCRAVMKVLSKRLDLKARSVSGQTLEEILDQTPAPTSDVIKTLENPCSNDPGLAIIKGTLAPEGAVVKIAAIPKDIREFKGKARVFEKEADAIERLNANHADCLKKGDVAVLRMMGPKGGPGTVFAASFMAALQGTSLGREVAVVTDGELSGLNSGITIGQVMPEAAEGGPLAYVEDGDEISIDINKRTIDLLVSEDMMKERVTSKQLNLPEAPAGWLSVYRATVGPLKRGAVVGDGIKRE